MPQIKIRLHNDGRIEAEGIDFQGEGCIEATKFLDELFGEAETIEYKQEFYLKTKETDKIFGGHCG